MINKGDDQMTEKLGDIHERVARDKWITAAYAGGVGRRAVPAIIEPLAPEAGVPQLHEPIPEGTPHAADSA